MVNDMYVTPLSKAFVDAGIELGHKNVDANGKEQLGKYVHCVGGISLMVMSGTSSMGRVTWTETECISSEEVKQEIEQLCRTHGER